MKISNKSLCNYQLEDLLGKAPVKINTEGLKQTVRGKRVLVTGAGGSIGSELCRQLAAYEPAELVLLGHGEHSIFTLSSEFARTFPRLTAVRAIADIRDSDRIEQTFFRNKPHVVFHAAAHKHVPLMEENLEEAILNNVLGTLNVVKASEAVGVEKLVMISSDKAVKPASVMGVTKRISELIISRAGLCSGKSFASVRFGNVLGSRGSVLDVFHEQISRGEPVTVTHPDMRRYFMTITEAVHLVLQAMMFGKRGEIFVLDMGEPVRIADIARKMVELSGLEVGRDVEIRYTGIRPGEKLFEELFQTDDCYEETEHEKIFVLRRHAEPRGPTPNGHEPDRLHDFDLHITNLIKAARQGEQATIFHYLKLIVPEYQASARAALPTFS